MAIRVLICEDAPGFSILARAWLDDDPELEVVGVAGTARDAVDSAARLEPNVILLDRTLPDAIDVDEVVRRLRTTAPTTSIVLMSSLAPDQLAGDAERVGACASVPKTAPAEVLREAVRRAGTASENLSRRD